MVYKKYVECRCISDAFVKDVNDIFDEYKQLKIADKSFKNITLEQINLIEESVKYFDPKDQDKIRANLLYAIEHPQHGKTMEFIRRYLEKCGCPPEIHINYRDGFHPYENIKKMMKDLMD